MTGRSLEKFVAAGVVVYVVLVLGLAFTAGQIPPEGWRPLVAFLLVVATGGAIALAYLARGPTSVALWILGGALSLAAVLATFIPGSSSPDGPDDSTPAPGIVSSPPESSRPDPSGSTTPSHTPTDSTPSWTPPATTDQRPREVDVKIGTATLLYGGDLRLSLSGAFDNFAWMGMFTHDQSCDTLSPDVGETLVMVDDSETVAYEMTLLATAQDPDSVHVEVWRRAPGEYEVGCP